MKGAMRLIASRLGIAFIFVVFGAWEMRDPSYWSAFVPQVLSSFGNTNALVAVHGLVMLAVGVGVLSGFRIRIFGALSSMLMLSVVSGLYLSSGFTDLLVRDVAILAFAVSLALEDEEAASGYDAISIAKAALERLRGGHA